MSNSTIRNNLIKTIITKFDQKNAPPNSKPYIAKPNKAYFPKNVPSGISKTQHKNLYSSADRVPKFSEVVAATSANERKLEQLNQEFAKVGQDIRQLIISQKSNGKLIKATENQSRIFKLEKTYKASLDNYHTLSQRQAKNPYSILQHVVNSAIQLRQMIIREIIVELLHAMDNLNKRIIVSNQRVAKPKEKNSNNSPHFNQILIKQPLLSEAKQIYYLQLKYKKLQQPLSTSVVQYPPFHEQKLARLLTECETTYLQLLQQFNESAVIHQLNQEVSLLFRKLEACKDKLEANYVVCEEKIIKYYEPVQSKINFAKGNLRKLKWHAGTEQYAYRKGEGRLFYPGEAEASSRAKELQQFAQQRVNSFKQNYAHFVKLWQQLLQRTATSHIRTDTISSLEKLVNILKIQVETSQKDNASIQDKLAKFV
jgi:hypothetical protein